MPSRRASGATVACHRSARRAWCHAHAARCVPRPGRSAPRRRYRVVPLPEHRAPRRDLLPRRRPWRDSARTRPRAGRCDCIRPTIAATVPGAARRKRGWGTWVGTRRARPGDADRRRRAAAASRRARIVPECPRVLRGASYPTVHRPSRAARAARPPRASWPEPALVVAPPTLDLFARSTRHCGTPSASDPVRLLGRGQPRPARGAREGRAFLGRLAAAHADLSDYLTDARWYQRKAGTTRRRVDRATSRRSSASPRCCRSTPAVSASSPATTSRRPATSACRSSASGCSTAPATSSSRSTPRAGSRSATRCSTPTACR